MSDPSGCQNFNDTPAAFDGAQPTQLYVQTNASFARGAVDGEGYVCSSEGLGGWGGELDATRGCVLRVAGCCAAQKKCGRERKRGIYAATGEIRLT